MLFILLLFIKSKPKKTPKVMCKLTKADFNQAVEMYRAKTKGRVSSEEARMRVKAIMEENDVQPKRAGWVIRSRRWYNSIKAV